MFDDITYVAHRGYSAMAPENTYAAFDLALKNGYKDIEFDVHLSSDGFPVVIHDISLDRTTTGHGLVADHPLNEIQKLDAGSWFGPEFSGEPVPEFSELLHRYKGRANLHIELKKDIPGLAEKVAAALFESGWIDDALAQSQADSRHDPILILSGEDREHIAKLRELLPPTIVLEFLVDVVTDESMLWAAHQGVRSYLPDGNDVTHELLKKTRALHLELGAWWWTRAEQDPSWVASQGAKYVFVDAPPLAEDYFQFGLHP